VLSVGTINVFKIIQLICRGLFECGYVGTR
jgi:hypothetical protein